jgi:hypothetical protein
MWRATRIPFVPAQAGTQNEKHKSFDFDSWVPAFAGTIGA